MPIDIPRIVKSLADEELLLFQKLADFLDREEQAVESGDMESLLRILEEKQSVISEQELLSERWSALCGHIGLKEGREGPALWEALALRVSIDGYSEIALLIGKIKDAGSSLLEREALVRGKLEANLREMRGLLRQIGTGRSALSGYNKNIARF